MTRNLFSRKTILLLVFALMTGNMIFAQTYLYKRVAIVKNGNRKATNDDAHYLTFNKSGCYESDANGYSLGGGLIKFRKNNNNLHCYYGQGAYGLSHYYFSNNYGRLNIKTDEGTFVYEREASGNTTASLRKTDTGNSNGNVILVSPPPIISSETSSSSSSSSSSTRQSEYGYVDCTHCYGSGKCSVCNGKGWVYSTYTQDPATCSSCHGRKNCVFCQGTGKRYRRIR